MTTTHQHAITATLGLTAILALVAFAVHGEASPALGAACDSPAACDKAMPEARSPEPRHDLAPARRAARAHLTMPYFSYARALPRTTEL